MHHIRIVAIIPCRVTDHGDIVISVDGLFRQLGSGRPFTTQNAFSDRGAPALFLHCTITQKILPSMDKTAHALVFPSFSMPSM